MDDPSDVLVRVEHLPDGRIEIRAGQRFHAVTTVAADMLATARAPAELMARLSENTERGLIHEIDRWLQEYAKKYGISLIADAAVHEAYSRGLRDGMERLRPAWAVPPWAATGKPTDR